MIRLFLNGASKQLATSFDAFEESVESLDNVRIQAQALGRAYQNGEPCPYHACECTKERRA